jgi:hypothetical protein
MSEARKYRLSLTVANQFTTQLTDEIRDAVFGNMGTIISFRVGQNDVEALARYFQPLFDGDDLLRIPNYNTIVRTLIGGVPTQPFSMATIPPLGNPNEELGKALKQLSYAKFAQPRQIIEKEIFARLKTNEVLGSARANVQPGNTSVTQNQRQASNPNASFLDQWLEKKKRADQPQSKQSSPKTNLVYKGASSQSDLIGQSTSNTSNDSVGQNNNTKDTGSPSDLSTKKISNPRDNSFFIDRDGNIKDVN